MAIETTQTERTIHLHGLYEREAENGDTEETFFALSMNVDNNSPIGAAVANCLTMHGILPADVTEFQTAYIERRNKLNIPDGEFDQ